VTSPTIEDQLELFNGFSSSAAAMGVCKVKDCEARITGGESPDRRVVLFFSHDDFPAVRFGYRCKAPGEDRDEEVWLCEELATGALHRKMRYERPVPDEDGIVWTRLHGALLGEDDEAVQPKLRLRAIAQVMATKDGGTCGIFSWGNDEPHPCGAPAVAKVSADTFDRAVVGEDMYPLREPSARYVGACRDHVHELRRRAELRSGHVEFVDAPTERPQRGRAGLSESRPTFAHVCPR
jgi:hypothetical protein